MFPCFAPGHVRKMNRPPPRHQESDSPSKSGRDFAGYMGWHGVGTTRAQLTLCAPNLATHGDHMSFKRLTFSFGALALALIAAPHAQAQTCQTTNDCHKG